MAKIENNTELLNNQLMVEIGGKMVESSKLDMLHTMSIQELSDLIQQCKTVMNAKGGKKNMLKVGMEVMVDHPRLAGMEGIITKINKTKCKVDMGGSTYNVPFDLIETI